MKKFILFATLFLTIQKGYCADFGRFQYSKAYALQRQMQYNQISRARANAINSYYSNPTRNIRYPNAYSKYPNIERNANRASSNRYSIYY